MSSPRGMYVVGKPNVVAPGGNARMITTILAVVALSGSLAPGAKPEFQAQTDYGQALKRAADEKKPMAVLIGKGDVFATLMTDAGLSDQAKTTLRDKFVCVAVDVNTPNG